VVFPQLKAGAFPGHSPYLSASDNAGRANPVNLRARLI
jgi:hypothetical protein